MIVGLMVTNGGPHPPEKWAAVTAQKIVDDFRLNAPEAIYAEVMGARDEIERILVEHHRMVQTDERASLEQEGPERLAEEIPADQYVDDAVDEILSLFKGAAAERAKQYPSLAEYFERPETRNYMERVLHQEFHHVMVIERSWHADANPDHEHAKAFHAALVGEAEAHHPVTRTLAPTFGRAARFY